MTEAKTARSRADAATRRARQLAELAGAAYGFALNSELRLAVAHAAGDVAAATGHALAVRMWRQLGDDSLNDSTRATADARAHAAEATS
jgi:hypothetical protein